MSRIAPTANKRPQLTKIMNMIGVKYGYYKLESFDHQLNWPWRPRMSTIPGVTIEIFEKSKEEAAEDHKKWLETNEKLTENL